jgi:Na+-driven multidrug efflux pump
VVIGDAIRGSRDTRWMLGTQVFGTIFTVAGAAVLILGMRSGLLMVFVLGFADEMMRAAMNFWRFTSQHREGTVETDSVIKTVLYRAIGIKSIMKT